MPPNSGAKTSRGLKPFDQVKIRALVYIVRIVLEDPRVLIFDRKLGGNSAPQDLLHKPDRRGMF